jgi:hypothetical protein
MRKWIDAVSLTESVDFGPREKIDKDGEVWVQYPDEHCREETVDCPYCEGGKDHFDDECGYCHGKGEVEKWQYDMPEMRVSYMHTDLLTDVLGREFDHVGYIPPEELPELRRRLIRIINGDGDEFARPDTEQGGETFVDSDGDIPQIRKTAKVYGQGIPGPQVVAGAQRMLDIIDWAQKKGFGVGWG